VKRKEGKTGEFLRRFVRGGEKTGPPKKIRICIKEAKWYSNLIRGREKGTVGTVVHHFGRQGRGGLGGGVWGEVGEPDASRSLDLSRIIHSAGKEPSSKIKLLIVLQEAFEVEKPMQPLIRKVNMLG